MKKMRPWIFAMIPLVSMAVAVARSPELRRENPPDVSVDFLVSGRTLPIAGSREGEPFVVVPHWGTEYEIRLTNRERHDRVLFVIGVDGLSVMDGSRASQRSGGYVLEPGATERIRGWRRGMDHVAAFTFTERSDSYAGRTGRSGNIGEIWVWAIREENRQPPISIAPAREADHQAKAAGSVFRERRETGTGYGQELNDRTWRTTFARSDSVRYLGFRYGLRPMPGPYYYEGEPARSSRDFTPPPPGWRRGRE